MNTRTSGGRGGGPKSKQRRRGEVGVVCLHYLGHASGAVAGKRGGPRSRTEQNRGTQHKANAHLAGPTVTATATATVLAVAEVAAEVAAEVEALQTISEAASAGAVAAVAVAVAV